MRKLLRVFLLGILAFQPILAQDSQDHGPVTVVTKDHKEYYSVEYYFRENGLLLVNSEGNTVLPYDQLGDLSEFPKGVQDAIKARQTPPSVAMDDDSTLNVTMKSGTSI